jgi:hypothetical protein
MEDDQEQRPESLLPYETWIETAQRQVVAQAIDYVGAHGLPGGHHFYITFRTDHPGVAIPARLRAQYPREMTIVLQHQFWDLKYDPDSHDISVGLSFGGVGSILVIPMDALISFADPQVQYGLRFNPKMPEAVEEPTEAEPPPETENPSEQPQVVSLDAFRRRPPTKN